MFKSFEKGVLLILLFLMGLVVVAALVEMLYESFIYATNDAGLLLDLDELIHIFGWFLLVLIAVELMSSVANFIERKSINIETMILIALTAVSRKVILLESKEYDPIYLMGVSSLVITLSVGFYLVRKRN